MTEHPDFAQPQRDDVEVRVRRRPKYGAFMALGAALGALAAWAISFAYVGPHQNEAGQAVDTTPVVGLMLVVGFVAGGVLGALAAIIAERAVGRSSTTLVAERTLVEAPERHVDARQADAPEPHATDARPADAGRTDEAAAVDVTPESGAGRA